MPVLLRESVGAELGSRLCCNRIHGTSEKRIQRSLHLRRTFDHAYQAGPGQLVERPLAAPRARERGLRIGPRFEQRTEIGAYVVERRGRHAKKSAATRRHSNRGGNRM